jgi:dTMP kinase
VYTVAKRNPKLSFDWARAPDVGLPAPDICFFLDISEEEAAKRGGGYGEEKYETRERQRAVKEEFHKLIEYESNINIVKVDAGRSVEAVEKELLDAVIGSMGKDEPLGRVLANQQT